MCNEVYSVYLLEANYLVQLPPASWGASFKCVVYSHLRIPPLSKLRGFLGGFYEIPNGA